MSSNRVVVKTRIGGFERYLIWDTAQPMELGYTLGMRIERLADAVERDLLGSEAGALVSVGRLDMASTGLLLAFSAMVGLFHKQRTGEGQRIDVSLFGTAVALQCQELAAWLNLDLRWERSQAASKALTLASSSARQS